MIPTIGIMIAAYIVFRCVESIVSMADGGAHSDLPIGWQVLLTLVAGAVTVLAIASAAELWQTGTEADAALRDLTRSLSAQGW